MTLMISHDFSKNQDITSWLLQFTSVSDNNRVL
jgi:hypothetical protein